MGPEEEADEVPEFDRVQYAADVRSGHGTVLCDLLHDLPVVQQLLADLGSRLEFTTQPGVQLDPFMSDLGVGVSYFF